MKDELRAAQQTIFTAVILFIITLVAKGNAESLQTSMIFMILFYVILIYNKLNK